MFVFLKNLLSCCFRPSCPSSPSIDLSVGSSSTVPGLDVPRGDVAIIRGYEDNANGSLCIVRGLKFAHAIEFRKVGDSPHRMVDTVFYYGELLNA